jgi:hypothetical protein
MESAGNLGPGDPERGRSMAAKSTTKKSGGEKPAPKKVPSKKATPERDGSDRHTASAKARPAPKAKKAPPSQKDTTFNEETAQVLRDAEAGKNLLHYPSVEAMYEDLGL